MAAAALLAGWAGVAGLPAARAVATGTVPQYDHVFWVVESGQPASAVIGAAPYLTSLAGSNARLDAYTAVDASPLADRLALAGGQTGDAVDCLPAQCSQSGDNLASRIEASGRSWRAYAESMPAPCSTTASPDFTPQRVPFLYYSSLAAECATNVVPYAQLASDLASTATTPSFAWISPNLQDDMSSSVAQGDSWLLVNLPAILDSAAWRTQHSLLVVVIDQPGAGGNTATPVAAVVMASDGSVRPGYRSPARYDHYDLLSTVEASWGLPALTGNDAGAAAISDVFTTQPTPTPPPGPSATPAPTAAPTPNIAPSPSAVPVPGQTSSPAPPSAASPSPGAAPGAPATPGGAGGPHRSSPAIVAATPGSNEFTLASPVIDVVNLAYVGATTISSGSIASLPVLEFTATSLTLSSGGASPALTLQAPCTTQNTMSLSQLSTVPAAATASFSGGVTLYVTSIDFTYLGTPSSLVAATPPLSFGPIASGQLTAVAMVAAGVHAATTSLPSLQTVAFFQC